jgi:3-hydroxyisobutyrate dehydrogenase
MKVGIVGTGLMGLPMALRLQGQTLADDAASPVEVIAWNRTGKKLEPLIEAGVAIASSPADLFQQADVIILMLSDVVAIRELLFPAEIPADAPSTDLPAEEGEGATPPLHSYTFIQMGTIAPSESRDLLSDILAAGGDYLEAPVLGSIPQVKSGRLQVMMGGTVAQFDEWRSLLQLLGEPLYIGMVGSAAALKLALNQLIGSLTTAFAQSLRFVQQQEVPVDTFMAVLRESALFAPTFDKKLERMLDQNFENPNFPSKHLLKDIRLFLQEARAEGLRVDSVEGVRQILEATCNQGLADADYSALSAVLQFSETDETSPKE